MQAAQVEQEEGVHGAEPQAAALRELPGPRGVVHQPAHLAGGEVGIERQAGFRHHQRFDAFAFQALDLRLGALILPNDGVVQRQAAVGVPGQQAFALMPQTDGVHHVALAETAADIRQNLQGVVFHPARIGGELLVRHAGRRMVPAVFAEHHDSGAGGSLINRGITLIHHCFTLL